MSGAYQKNLSSLEMLLMGLTSPAASGGEPLRSGMLCPDCRLGRLDYSGLLQLECPRCGFVSAEGAGCT